MTTRDLGKRGGVAAAVGSGLLGCAQEGLASWDQGGFRMLLLMLAADSPARELNIY
jgi:hypothetical protein